MADTKCIYCPPLWPGGIPKEAITAWHKAGHPRGKNPDNHRELRDLEQRIIEMGKAFRALTLHSNGDWTVQYFDDKGKHLVQAKTPTQAVLKAEERLLG